MDASDLFDEEACEVINVKDLSSYLENDEVSVFDMTSLGDFVVQGHPLNAPSEEDVLNRLSLAYENLHNIPKILLEDVAPLVQILDLSHNEFKNLDFLSAFTSLTNLICDHNNITEEIILPYLPKLELLWLNNCKIQSLYPWAKKLQNSCPNLRYLSLMGNPMSPYCFNDGNFYEFLQYRLFVISLFPELKHLDDRFVTEDQRTEAERLYRKPLIDRLTQKTHIQMPEYLRQVSDAVSDIMSPTPSFIKQQEKNLII